MALFSSTMTRPACRLRENGWQEISYRVFPSWVSAFFRAQVPFTRTFIRKNESMQWYEEAKEAAVLPVSIERMLYLDDVWDRYEISLELFGSQDAEYADGIEDPETSDEEPRPTA